MSDVLLLENVKEKMKTLKRKKFPFIEHVSENNDNGHLLEDIMALENEQQRLVEGVRHYRNSPSITANYSHFMNAEYKGKKIGCLNAMCLEYFKNKNCLKNLLSKWINEIEEETLVYVPYKEPVKTYKETLIYSDDCELKTEEELKDYIENSEPVNTLHYDNYLSGKKERILGSNSEQRFKHSKTKIALTI